MTKEGRNEGKKGGSLSVKKVYGGSKWRSWMLIEKSGVCALKR